MICQYHLRKRVGMEFSDPPAYAGGTDLTFSERKAMMSQTSILSRCEIETMGPLVPEELSETEVAEAFLSDLALKHVAMMAEPTTHTVAERLHLPRTLTEELLQQLYREKLIEVRQQTTFGS